MRLDLNTDPSVTRVVVVAILLMAEKLLMSLIVYTQQDLMPTETQLITMICDALLTLVIFISTFIRTGEIPPEE